LETCPGAFDLEFLSVWNRNWRKKKRVHDDDDRTVDIAHFRPLVWLTSLLLSLQFRRTNQGFRRRSS
jgi:hypothetical protein